MNTRWRQLAAAAMVMAATLWGAGEAMADRIKVAGVYSLPVQQKWISRLHTALQNAHDDGEVGYIFSEKVPASDYVGALRRYAGGGARLIVGESFGITREARAVADDYPHVAFLMGDPLKPHGANFAVFDNYIHEPAYLMGILAGAMTTSNRIGMVGGYPIGEINRLFHAFMGGARSVNPAARFKVAFIGTWYDPTKARAAALAQVKTGVDVLYADRTGVVEAARESGVLAFGNVIDMNRKENGKNVVVTSALWDMNAAIRNAIREVKEGRFKAVDYREWTMMRRGGARLAPYYEFEDRIPTAAKARVAEVQAEILAGRYVVEINDTVPKSTY